MLSGKDFLASVRRAQRIEFGASSLLIPQEIGERVADSLSPLFAPGESVYYGLATEDSLQPSATTDNKLIGKAEWCLVLGRSFLRMTAEGATAAQRQPNTLHVECKLYPLMKLQHVDIKLTHEKPGQARVSLQFEGEAAPVTVDSGRSVSLDGARAFVAAVIQQHHRRNEATGDGEDRQGS